MNSCVIPIFRPGSVWRFALLWCWLLLLTAPAFAQRQYTIEKPRARAANEKVAAARKATQASKGILTVLLDPVIAGKIVVADAQGRVLDEAEADAASGRVEFELRRGQSYTVKASSPGFLAAESKSGLLKASGVVRLPLRAQFAKLELPNLPPGAQVLIDDKLRATTDQTGQVVLDNLEPGKHALLVRHPEYNDYRAEFDNLEAGSAVRFPPMRTLLSKVAKLTIQALPGATVLLDGEFQGRVNPDGAVQFDYPLAQAAEHTLTIELLGYQTWTKREMLTPGARTITVKLDPVVTSAGMSDLFDSLSLWRAPAKWKIKAGKLQVDGPQSGLLKDKLFRDFDLNFTVWLPDGKGATWLVRADKEGRSYYLFHLAGPKSALTPRRLHTFLMLDGGEPVEVNTPTPVTVELNDKDSYTIHIELRGHTVKHTITSNASGDSSDAIWTDTAQTKDRFLYGTLGFRSYAGEEFLVDDLTIELPKQ